jgi:ribose transport system ATP-binding protein
MRAIAKRFPGVVALDQVDFDVHGGEVVALVGENGAGKSTLMKILAGIHRPDSGEIRLDGTPVGIASPSSAARLGVATIHQELEMIDALDVAGNIFLGREPQRAGALWLLDRRRMERETTQHLARVGATMSPRAIVGQLSTAQQQLVAIARALSVDARILILDEPTASLGSTDAERLFGVLNDLRRRGVAIIYISHRLGEIESLADRAVVLRDGRNAGTLTGGAIRRDRLVHLMVGRALETEYATRGAAGNTSCPVSRIPRLQIDGVRTARYPDAEASLTVYRGEVLGIAGLIGAGRSELAEAVCGIAPRIAGRVLLDGTPITIATPGDAIRQGVCLVPEDRRGHGVIAGMTVRENLTLPSLATFARWGLVRRRAESRAAQEIATSLTVKTPSLESPIGTLSGGNQQKVVLGRWLALRPRAIVFDEPTQGVDVGAKAEIHRLIRRLADDGAAVVMISSDLEEILAESDRVAVMHEGLVTGVLDRADCTPDAIMQLAVA